MRRFQSLAKVSLRVVSLCASKCAIVDFKFAAEAAVRGDLSV